MKIKGVDYDLGVVYAEGISSRPSFDPVIVKREIEIIKNDLHCNAIRLCGLDLERLKMAAEFAFEQDLEIWFVPRYIDATMEVTLPYLVEWAQIAEKLRREYPKIIFVIGSEFTFLMNGILEGENLFERLSISANWERFRRGEHNKPLNDFLAKAVAEIRQHFHGPLTYASLPLEKVDWDLFDLVGLDHYREVHNRQTYSEKLQPYFAYGKPVVITEFGCCAYKGAEDKGARGWEVADMTADPPQIKGDTVRDETVQANEISAMLQILDAAKVEGAFIYTFVTPSLPFNEIPKFDFDIAGYGLVKSYSDRMGTTYPDMPWDTKEAFQVVANYYANSK